MGADRHWGVRGRTALRGSTDVLRSRGNSSHLGVKDRRRRPNAVQIRSACNASFSLDAGSNLFGPPFCVRLRALDGN